MWKFCLMVFFSPDCMLLNLAYVFLIDILFLKVNLSLPRTT